MAGDGWKVPVVGGNVEYGIEACKAEAISATFPQASRGKNPATKAGAVKLQANPTCASFTAQSVLGTTLFRRNSYRNTA